MSDPITYTASHGVAHIELNRPAAANALDMDTARALANAVQQSASDDEVAAVLVTGAGKRFCAGGDVVSVTKARDRSAYIRQLATELDTGFQQLGSLEKPVIAAVQGAVAGAGLALMLSCDLVVAHPSTQFVFAYAGVGFTPDCGVSYLLPRAIGQQRALRFALLGEPASARDAEAWGMVTEVSDDPVTRARQLAVSIAEGPALALGMTRSLLRSSWEMTRAESGSQETRTIVQMVQGSQAQALLARFGSG